MHILARPERAALPASVGDGVEAVIYFQKETDMATFVPISGRGAQSVYVNPERINYIRIRNEKTVLYFDKDQAVETDDPVSTVLAALSLSAS